MTTFFQSTSTFIRGSRVIWDILLRPWGLIKMHFNSFAKEWSLAGDELFISMIPWLWFVWNFVNHSKKNLWNQRLCKTRTSSGTWWPTAKPQMTESHSWQSSHFLKSGICFGFWNNSKLPEKWCQFILLICLFFSAVLGRGEEAQEAEASLDSQTGMSKMMNHSVEFVIEKPRDQPRMIKSHLPLAVLPSKASFDTKHFSFKFNNFVVFFKNSEKPILVSIFTE